MHARRATCPCFATLHPFCDLFHDWLSRRLEINGSGGGGGGGGGGCGGGGGSSAASAPPTKAMLPAQLLAMGEAAEGRPVAIVRDARADAPHLPAAALLRPEAEDLFR